MMMMMMMMMMNDALRRGFCRSGCSVASEAELNSDAVEQR